MDAPTLRHLSRDRSVGKRFRMSDEASNKMSREERLAAKLRENLRRRKSQAREMAPVINRESGESGVSKGADES